MIALYSILKAMINPSATGWIDKFFSEQMPVQLPAVEFPLTLYKKIRSTGFLYGHVVGFNILNEIDTKRWTSEELSKVSLLNSLFNVFELVTHESNFETFVEKSVRFYQEMNSEGFSLLKKVLPHNTLSIELEEIIDDRVQTNHNIFSKNFSPILTNALLFEDVLAFQQFLLCGNIPNNYLKKLEETIVKIATLGLKTKNTKSNYDELLIKLFESSVRYTKFSAIDVQNLDGLELHYFTSDLEKYYFIDIAGISLWSEKSENDENDFLLDLAENTGVSDDFVLESIKERNEFIKKYKNEIPYFNYSNPVKHFYDHSVQSVTVLISRNKKRLIKELSNNGELMVLLTHSTHRHLEDNEKKKVKKQLLEICKTIPSLTIFLLPGGSLLLPILIKFIPKMLPSVFNENLEPD
jgi:hypothetical protein